MTDRLDNYGCISLNTDFLADFDNIHDYTCILQLWNVDYFVDIPFMSFALCAIRPGR